MGLQSLGGKGENLVERKPTRSTQQKKTEEGSFWVGGGVRQTEGKEKKPKRARDVKKKGKGTCLWPDTGDKT